MIWLIVWFVALTAAIALLIGLIRRNPWFWGKS
jgi:hypothetical protein